MESADSSTPRRIGEGQLLTTGGRQRGVVVSSVKRRVRGGREGGGEGQPKVGTVFQLAGSMARDDSFVPAGTHFGTFSLPSYGPQDKERKGS